MGAPAKLTRLTAWRAATVPDQESPAGGSTSWRRAGAVLEKRPPPPSPGDRTDAFVVRFAEADPDDPKNWSPYYKAWITFQLGMLAISGSMGASIVAPAEPYVAEEFGLRREVTVLMLALFILGYAFGPSIWAPISEVYGRRWSMLPAILLLVCFSLATAFSQSPAALFATRFFGGVFGSAPISNVSAALGDIYVPRTRGVASAFYAVAVMGGPTLAPVIGAALTVHPSLGWRWTEYFEAIFTSVILVLTFCALPETYPPVLLKRKAQRLRSEDSRYWHPHESEKMELGNIVTKYFSRPIRMFLTEPMVLCIALYASFIFGILFLQLEVFPIIFRDQRGWGVVASALPFLGLFGGVLAAAALNIANQPLYVRAVDGNKGRAVPEARLPPLVLGQALLTAGLFWLGWTAGPAHHWAVPVAAGGTVACGFTVAFQQSLNFLVDVYGPFAASAVSANTILRSVMACGLPLAARPMFLGMGVGPASSVLGGISCLALPVPFVFMRYGPRLRKRSKFASAEEV